MSRVPLVLLLLVLMLGGISQTGRAGPTSTGPPISESRVIGLAPFVETNIAASRAAAISHSKDAALTLLVDQVLNPDLPLASRQQLMDHLRSTPQKFFKRFEVLREWKEDLNYFVEVSYDYDSSIFYSEVFRVLKSGCAFKEWTFPLSSILALEFIQDKRPINHPELTLAWQNALKKGCFRSIPIDPQKLTQIKSSLRLGRLAEARNRVKSVGARWLLVGQVDMRESGCQRNGKIVISECRAGVLLKAVEVGLGQEIQLDKLEIAGKEIDFEKSLLWKKVLALPESLMSHTSDNSPPSVPAPVANPSPIIKPAAVITTSVSPSAPLPQNPHKEDPSFTSLILEAKNLGVQSYMTASIFTPSGKRLFGHIPFADALISEGSTHWFGSMEDAKGHSAAGSNPLIIKAIGCRDGYGTVVVSEEDGQKIIDENQKSRFLDNWKVIVVK